MDNLPFLFNPSLTIVREGFVVLTRIFVMQTLGFKLCLATSDVTSRKSDFNLLVPDLLVRIPVLSPPEDPILERGSIVLILLLEKESSCIWSYMPRPPKAM